MSSDPNKSENNTTKPRLPEWLVILFGLLFYAGLLYTNKYGGRLDARVYEPYKNWEEVKNNWPTSNEDPMVAEGRQVYTTYCSPCHQVTGMGLNGVAPPLVGSEWVLAEGPNRIIRIVLNGLTGPVTVEGKEFNLTMVPWRSSLSDHQIAAVLTFIRQNSDWEGHDASPVTEEEVAAIREATSSRATQWTAPELEAIPVSE